jgi:hypothetical protein
MYSAEVCVVHASAGEVVRRYPPPMSDDTIPAAELDAILAELGARRSSSSTSTKLARLRCV